MGYIRHNAIIVTSWQPLAEVAAKASELGLLLSGPTASLVNGYETLLICPDGSKEGWEASNEGNRRRALFKDYLRTLRYEDGSSPMAWADIAYGGDDEEAVVDESEWSPTASGNDADARSDEEK